MPGGRSGCTSGSTGPITRRSAACLRCSAPSWSAPGNGPRQSKSCGSPSASSSARRAPNRSTRRSPWWRRRPAPASPALPTSTSWRGSMPGSRRPIVRRRSVTRTPCHSAGGLEASGERVAGSASASSPAVPETATTKKGNQHDDDENRLERHVDHAVACGVPRADLVQSRRDLLVALVERACARARSHRSVSSAPTRPRPVRFERWHGARGATPSRSTPRSRGADHPVVCTLHLSDPVTARASDRSLWVTIASSGSGRDCLRRSELRCGDLGIA